MVRRGGFLLAGAAAAPVVVAGADGVRFARRAAAARRRGEPLWPDVPAPAPSAALAGAVAVDALLGMPITLLSSTGSAALYDRASAELDAAAAFYGEAGWLDDPAARHRTPPAAVVDGAIERGGDGIEVLRFASGWEPEPGEPGGDRWRSVAGNGTVPVRLLRHPGEPRPWLVAVHGQGMGRPGDVRMLRVRRLHEELGVNVALPVLPMHGRRAAGFEPDQQFVSNLFVANNVLGLTQAAWDLRRLLGWLREEQAAPAVGVLGLSLGSLACGLLSTLDADLACVVVVVPTSDLAASLRRAEPLTASRKRRHRALHDERSIAVHGVISPVARPCLVPPDRRFIVAGQGDQVADPAGAAELWRHWDEPSILWRPRGHLTTPVSSAYDQHLTTVLATSGLTTERETPCAS